MLIPQKHIKDIENLLGSNAVLLNEPMSRHTTFQIGGPCDVMALPSNTGQIAALLYLARENGLPVMVIGGGSNLLVSDDGIDGIIIKIGEAMADIRRDGNNITAQAGARLNTLCKFAAQQGLTGLEFLFGIPGTVGGAVCMNAGAYGGEIAGVTRSTEVLELTGRAVSFDGGGHQFGYRQSVFSGGEYAVLSAAFALEPGESVEIDARMRELWQRRKDKQPLELPSAGSVFKRPPGQFAGALIEAAGLKGQRIGGARVSPKHAGFIVNEGGATCREVLELIGLIRRRVFEISGILLECEIRAVGRGI